MDCSRDSISSLPDEVLGIILSLLPTKVAASTSVLSKRWRNLLVLVDNLCFDDSLVVYPNEEEARNGLHRFLDFVDKTFALLSNSPIKKFSLCTDTCRYSRIGNISDLVNSCVNRWFDTAMKRGLLDVYLHANAIPWDGFDLYTIFLTSNTLVKLTLSGQYELFVESVFFPALRSLSLLSVLISYDNYCRLIDGCPVLEELFIHDTNHWIPPCIGTVVESASIKRLVVVTHNLESNYQEDHKLVCFEAPSLVYLDYSCLVSREYQFVDLDLLVEARLNLMLWFLDGDGNEYDYDSEVDEPKEAMYGDVTGIFTGISSITTLHLSHDSLEAIHFCCESMPVFNNLLTLSIESNKEKGWQVMPLLFKSCPNLQTLVMKACRQIGLLFQGLLHRVTNRCGDACACIPKKPRNIVNKEEEELSCLWTCQVKVLEISEYGGSFQELEQMRHFLGKLECLETVNVGVDANKNKRDIGEWQEDGSGKIIDRKKNIFKLSQGEYVAVENLETLTQDVLSLLSFESFLVGVVVPERKAIEDWAKLNNQSPNDFESLCQNLKAQKYFLDELNATAKQYQLKGFEMLKATHLEPNLFDIERDLITPTFKLKRPQLLQHYKDIVDQLYRDAKGSKA